MTGIWGYQASGFVICAEYRRRGKVIRERYADSVYQDFASARVHAHDVFRYKQNRHDLLRQVDIELKHDGTIVCTATRNTMYYPWDGPPICVCCGGSFLDGPSYIKHHWQCPMATIELAKIVIDVDSAYKRFGHARDLLRMFYKDVQKNISENKVVAERVLHIFPVVGAVVNYGLANNFPALIKYVNEYEEPT